MSRVVCALAVALLLTAIRISAHHAFAAEYDDNKLVTVTGIVAKFEWINPHALLYVDGKDADGRAGSWKFEMGMEKDGFEGGRPNHRRRVRREGRKQLGQRTHSEVGEWPEAVRRLSVHSW